MHRVVVRGWCALVMCGVLPVGVGLAQDRAIEGIRILEAQELAAAFPGLKKTIAVRFEGKPIEQALRDIAAKADLDLTYSNITLPKRRTVWLTADRIRAGEALEKVLADAGLQLLPLANRRLVVVPASGLTRAPSSSIVGQITDAKTGQGITGVDVFLEGTRWRTNTDTLGRYRLAEVDVGRYTLTIRRLGYVKQNRKVTVDSERLDTIDMILDPAIVSLNELVTTATGPQRRRDLGNAITTVRADSVMQAAPIRTLTDLLDGRVPGLSVQHTSGAPGDPARLRLRGLSSVSRSNDPVVIVDGIRIYAAQADARSGNLTNLMSGILGSSAITSGAVPAPSPLDQIDPNTIEKVEVFKGPSAATLYGADAANGVIVITTKKGKPGPTRWQATATHGRTKTPGRWPEGYFRWGRDLLTNSAILCPIANTQCSQDSLVRFQALNDPALTLLGEGRNTTLSLQASGGSQSLTYMVSGSYSDETGLLMMPAFEAERFLTRFKREAPDWMQRPHKLETWNVASNVTARLGSTADLTLHTMLGRVQQQRSTLEQQVPILAGTYVDRVNDLYYRPSQTFTFTLVETADYLTKYYTKTTASSMAFTTGLNANWNPRSWFHASGTAGLNVIPRDDQTFLPAGLVTATDSGTVIRGTGHSLVSSFDIRGAVRRPWRWGLSFETNVGVNVQTAHIGDLVTSAKGLIPGTSAIAGAKQIFATDAASNTSVFGWYIEPRLASARWSINAGLRLDGGSSYGGDVTGLGNLLRLPKLGGSWVISEEPFFPFKSLFSSLRLRGAYGQAQVQPGPADKLRLYKYSTLTSTTVELTTLGNTELRPERSTEIEGGFDADLFDSRLSIELTAYRKTKVDALMPLTLPPSVNGGGSVPRNIGTIRNTGLELTLDLTPVQLPLLTWHTQLRYSRNRNVLTKLGRGVAPNPAQGLVEGYPLYGRWDKPILGYVDRNGDGVINPDRAGAGIYGEFRVGDSMVYMGQTLPTHTTAFSTDVAILGGALSISADFEYEAGMTQIDNTARNNWVLERAFADPDTPLSEQVAALANIALDGPQRTAYGAIQDVSIFRFRSFGMNYQVPARLAHLLRAQKMTIGVQGSNLGLHSTYRGKDPDVTTWSPSEGVTDTGQLPQPRLWLVRVGLQY